MSEKWIGRERDTNRLIGAIADYLLKQSSITPLQLYGLCKLTWITRGAEGENASYIRSTKIPALREIFGEQIETDTLKQAAQDVARVLRTPEILEWVEADTGFTAFYNAYRNTAQMYLQKHHKVVIRLVRAARDLTSDKGAELLTLDLSKLPPIPKANHPEQGMRPEYLLTPLLFSLDPRLRYPVINGRDSVQKLLKKMKVRDADLVTQHRAMVGLLGSPGIYDAADLDHVSQEGYLHELYAPPGEKPKLAKLIVKPTQGSILALKDEVDLVAVQVSLSQPKRRLHNKMTNRLMELWGPNFGLLEGFDPSARYDVRVKDYNKCLRGGERKDLLVEVKSSAEEPHVRMAIGQLYAYAHHLEPKYGLASAVLLPSEPSEKVKELLDWLKIGCLWFSDDALNDMKTSTSWLKHLAP